MATPPLADPHFDRTVILVLEHGPDGALGIVLNRPTALTLGQAVPAWRGKASAPAVVFTGGPVAEESVIALARGLGAPDDGWVELFDGLGTVDIGRDPPVTRLHSLRIFVGYAGWGAGQLEGELLAGGWFVVDARPTDPFTSDPSALWRDVLRRQRGRMAMFANCPPDPTEN